MWQFRRLGVGTGFASGPDLRGGRLGRGCVVGRGATWPDVVVGDHVKIELCPGVCPAELEDGCSSGRRGAHQRPAPRAVDVEGAQVRPRVGAGRVLVRKGASLGPGGVRRPVTIGRWAMVGAGAVVISTCLTSR